MRQRIEDLGRLAVLLKDILDKNGLFEMIDNSPKRWLEKFEVLPIHHQEDILHEIAYAIESLEGRLYECLAIAEATDTLNSYHNDLI